MQKEMDGCTVCTDCAAFVHHMQEIRELQAQVGDLMFYLDTQKKVASSADGVKQVSVCVFIISLGISLQFM